jgi:MFS transporter, DHA2 family, multidrug resistance protein
MFGVFYVMPQYFLDVRGLNSLASGVRMLSLIGGMLIGVTGGQRLQTTRRRKDGTEQRPVAGPRVMGTAGFAIMAVAMVMGTGTGVATGTGLLMTWFAIAGVGLGLSMPTMLNAALGALTPDRSGSGSALLSAMRQVGATIGVAVLGTVIATVYQNHLHLPGLPGPAASAARSSVAAGVSIALHAPAPASAALLGAVRHSYTAGVGIMLWICAGIAIASALLAALFLPGRKAATATDGQATSATPELGPHAYRSGLPSGQ